MHQYTVAVKGFSSPDNYLKDLGRLHFRKTIREMRIPFSDEVYIFGNEHDCEQLNVFVL